MAKSFIISKIIESNKSNYKIDKNGVYIFRCFSSVLYKKQENDMLKDIDLNFKKQKKERLVDTKWGLITVSQKKEIQGFIDSQEIALANKISQVLNV